MKIHRFLVNEKITEGGMSLVNKDLIHQIKNVLRLEIGETIIIFNEDNGEFQGVIKSIAKNIIKLGEVVKSSQILKIKNQAILYCAILKKENFEMVVQKATEVGIKKIVPLITGRTIKLNLNLERLKKIAQEAAEQSGRVDVPEISPVSSLKTVIELIPSGEVVWCLDTLTADQTIPQLKDKKIHLFVGPEGGWTDEERSFFKQKKFSFLSLGPLVLRGETAAIIASYLACNN